MTHIIISDLNINGSDLFQDTESFLNELTDNDLLIQAGWGITSSISIRDVPISEDIYSKSVSRIF